MEAEKQVETSKSSEVERLDTIISLLESNSKLSEKTLLKSFLHGLLTALGATIGFAIFIAVAGWLVGLLGGVPLIGDFFVELGDFLRQR